MNKFLIDECVDRKALRGVPISDKGFDILFPGDRTFSGAKDVSIIKLAQAESRALVTCDSDFQRLHVNPGDIPEGVLWLHPPRSSKKAISNLLNKFCRLRRKRFAASPYDFTGQIIAIENDGIRISNAGGTESLSWPADSSE